MKHTSMKHTYKISGMTSKHDIHSIQQILKKINGIQSVQVFFQSSELEVIMHHHIKTEMMNEELSKIGDFSLVMIPHKMAATHDNHPTHEGHSMKEHENHSAHEHHNHHRMMIKDFKKRLWVSLVLTLPVLLLSPMIQSWLGWDWTFQGDKYLLFALSSIIYFYGGYPFLKGLFEELRKKSPGMMTLIAVAITAAYLYSSAVVFGLEGKTFFWELATLIVVMLLGHWLEMRSILGASKALEALAALMPNEANLVHNNLVMKIKVSELKNGDIILIKPGEKVPADGIIVDGETDLNESMLTGESKPVHKSKDAKVIGGAINGSGAIKVKVKGVGKDTYLSKVINLVQEAQGQKSKTQRLADRAAFWLTIIALVAGLGTFAIWLSMGKELSFALERMVTVMVICCPHALGLAIPLVAAISTSVSAKNGLLIRNRTAFENSRKISTIVFDKTGTLTKGSHEVMRIVSLSDNYDKTEILRYAATVEGPSEHYISRGLQRKVEAENLKLLKVDDFKYQSGVGVSGTVDGKRIEAGGYILLEKLNIVPPNDKKTDIETKVFIVIDGELIGFITFADEIREGSINAIKTLQNNGIRVALLTGDNEKVAEAVAKELGMDDYMAEVLPDEKLEKIKSLQQKGEFVAMTGDGVNDAPALAQANVGIAIGSGTDVAAETADIVLVDSNPNDIANLILFGKATYRKMIQNLWWATGYNLIVLPLATGFIPGMMISPAFGAALMSLSTVICAANAQLLKKSMSTN